MELEKEYEVKQRDLQIECNQFIEEHKNIAIKEFLTERNEVQIELDELSKLREDLLILQTSERKELEECKKNEQEKHENNLKIALNNLELRHRAETAQLTANVNQKDNEIKTLHKSIDNLNQDVAAQRELTNQIAQSMKQAPISQNFGK